MKQKIIIIAGIVVFAVLGIGVYFLSINSNAPTPPQSNTVSDNSQSSQPTSSQPSSQQLNTNKPTQKMNHLITLKTSMGDIQFEAYDSDAPNTVANFIKLSEKGFYDNVIFHRVIKGFMIQGGDPTGTGTGGPGYAFADELNPSTASYQAGYKQGVVAMANAGPNTNGSQFFIMLADYPLPNNYTIFGKVVKGQDVVNAIGNLQTGPNDKPLNPPSIKSVVVQ